MREVDKRYLISCLKNIIKCVEKSESIIDANLDIDYSRDDFTKKVNVTDINIKIALKNRKL